MSHECPDCSEHCYCDLDDVDLPDMDCVHACDPYGLDEDEDRCIHVSATAQAGGWMVCDECGSDVTREMARKCMEE